eukprot:PhF_6_TR39642/c0_g2_i2/m.58783
MMRMMIATQSRTRFCIQRHRGHVTTVAQTMYWNGAPTHTAPPVTRSDQSVFPNTCSGSVTPAKVPNSKEVSDVQRAMLRIRRFLGSMCGPVLRATIGTHHGHLHAHIVVPLG